MIGNVATYGCVGGLVLVGRLGYTKRSSGVFYEE
jgi:hypothetical protein